MFHWQLAALHEWPFIPVQIYGGNKTGHWSRVAVDFRWPLWQLSLLLILPYVASVRQTLTQLIVFLWMFTSICKRTMLWCDVEEWFLNGLVSSICFDRKSVLFGIFLKPSIYKLHNLVWLVVKWYNFATKYSKPHNSVLI